MAVFHHVEIDHARIRAALGFDHALQPTGQAGRPGRVRMRGVRFF